MTPATVLLSPMRINVICIPMANTVAGTMRGRTVRKDIKSFPRNRYRIRALDVSTPIAADKTATTEEIIMLDAMRENNSPFLLTISMTARSESTWGNRPGQAHRSVNTHTTRLAAGIRMDAQSTARIILVIKRFSLLHLLPLHLLLLRQRLHIFLHNKIINPGAEYGENDNDSI